MSEASVTTNEINVVKAGSEEFKTAAKLADNKDKANKTKLIRNFTYELNDVEDIFTSKISFFLKELNTQLNALVNSNIYTENKEKLDKVLKSKGDFRKELLRLLKSTKYKDFYQKYYFEAKVFGNKAKYFRTVIEEYRRILLSRLHRQTIIDIIVKNPTITYQEVFNKLCELNERRSSGNGSNSDYKFNWISKAEFNNIIKQLNNLSKLNNLSSLNKFDNSTSEPNGEVAQRSSSQTSYETIDNLPSVAVSEAKTIDTYSIDYSSEDDQISEFNLTDNNEYYFIEFKLKYSDYTTQSDSLLTYSCKIPKKQIKGLTTGYTKLQKFTRPRIYLREDTDSEAGVAGVAKSATAAIMTTHMCWQHASSEASTDENPATVDVASKLGSESSKSVESSNGEQLAKQAEPERAKLAAIDFTQPAQLAISNELTISDKTQSVSKHIERLRNEQNHIYKKEKAIYDLLKLKQFDSYASETDTLANNVNVADELVNHASVVVKLQKLNDTDLQLRLALLYKYQRLNKLRLHLRHKVSNLKKELSFLTARDMISHAIDNEVDLITIEKLSWIRDERSNHITWDYNQIQQRIIHEANIYGIKVKKVSCAYSSAHNPLTLEKEEVDQNRKLVKCLFDRDYAAAIILARRGVKLGKRKLKLSLSCEAASHINESFQAVNYSIKPSQALQSSLPTLQYRQLKLCEPKSIISHFAYYSIL